MKRIGLALLLAVAQPAALAEGLRGEPAAIADARAMVQTMGGIAI